MTGLLSLVFWTLTLTSGSQQLLDQHGGLYVQDIRYIPIHSYTRLGKYVLRDFRKDKPRLTSCKIKETIINHRKDTTAILTGGQYYVQICKDSNYSFLFTITC